ncbi:23S ribosomal RNA methyltransferase Erm [Lederbergia sp. NSJ-179]|uniref:23S ribosomal RNA methyltransferase Erm n=1 Tax=Lederbergia sp. NSJ-179 TaxID=2931402 RepID=UPI001FD33E35|nr:23S ribosomal RNA methyltransferase Erm [Lederbergia sp. NSJ-179]MCJ7842998.1 23S ribosomal RNA methyltransferase Erm [Lederbergia sp. NSJ-179]
MTKKMHKYSNKKLSRGEPPNFLGQHFIHNKRLLKEMVGRAGLSSEDTVLELGAGKGALTAVLAEKAGKVLAVEYDGKLVGVLQRKMADVPNTKIIHQDIMNIHLPKEKFVVVSNIPYSLTTAIMKKLLNNPTNSFQRGIIVMEKGAAKGFTAKRVKDAYVLAWRMSFDIYYLKGISRNNFAPPPKVDSAMIKIIRKKEPIIAPKDSTAFLGLAEYALKKPQLPIEMALHGIFTAPQMKHLRRFLNIDHGTPIGTLNERQWGLIFKTMVQYVGRPYWPKVKNRKKRRF